MFRVLVFTLLGYLSGSILFAKVFTKLFKKEDCMALSKDGNPGTANAFQCDGFWCGMLTLVGDLLKGILPVYLYLLDFGEIKFYSFGFALVLAAPVIGHAFPVFFRFRGGKGIAVTFGCLIGLLPMWQPALILAVCFLFFSLILRVSPHYFRTAISYLCALILMKFLYDNTAVWYGFLLITGIVWIKLYQSGEKREPVRIKWLWMC